MIYYVTTIFFLRNRQEIPEGHLMVGTLNEWGKYVKSELNLLQDLEILSISHQYNDTEASLLVLIKTTSSNYQEILGH